MAELAALASWDPQPRCALPGRWTGTTSLWISAIQVESPFPHHVLGHEPCFNAKMRSLECQHVVRTGSLWHKPNLKSVRSRLGNGTCHFKSRAWGRFKSLEDRLEQHKPCQAASWTRTHHTCGGGDTLHCWCSIPGTCSVRCRPLGSHPVKHFLRGLFLGLTSLL